MNNLSGILKFHPAEKPDKIFNVESFAIVAIGIYLHLNQISTIELKYTKLPGIQPNIASTIFVFSVLCVLAKSRQYWLRCSHVPPRILQFLIELFLTLYATDRILRQAWMPLLKLVNFGCNFLGDYIIVVNSRILTKQMMAVSGWIRNQGFYFIRCLLALMAFYFMAEVTGLLNYCHTLVMDPVESHVRFSESPTSMRRRSSSLSESKTDSVISISNPSKETKTPKIFRKPIRATSKKYR